MAEHGWATSSRSRTSPLWRAATRTRVLGALALLAALGSAPAAPALAGGEPTAPAVEASGDAAEQGEREPRPLDIVVAVDESGSLTDADVHEEINAVSVIGQAALSPATRVSVVGFGSDNGAPGQEAATVVCEPTVVGEGNGRQYLADCASDLRRRTTEDGNDTDHAAALGRALSLLDSGDAPDGAARVIFLLTDGALDVARSPQYGDPGDRDDAALREIDQHLAAARESGVQIWPLGFGEEVNAPGNREQLAEFAAGGSQETCNDLETARPRARVVESSADVVRSLHEASAAATCSGLSDPDSAPLQGGDSVTLTVDIPVIATDGAILVTKNNPEISVEYRDPNGEVVPASGEHDQSVFERSGENSTVEALQIRDPRPGEWTVELTSPEGTGEELVTAVAQWQGAINTRLTVDGTGRLDEEVTVRVTLWTRRGAIDDPDALAGLDFATTVEGAGLEETPVELAEDDEVPGQYLGGLTTPATEGTLTFTSVVQGEGVAADERTHNYEISAAGAPLTARVRLDRVPETWPERPVTGTVTVVNNSGAPTEVRLVPQAPDGTLVAVEPALIEVGAGQHEAGFRVVFAGDSPRGPTTVAVQAVDPSGEVVGGSQPLTLTLRDAPGALETYWWAWPPLLLLLALTAVLALVRRARRRDRADVRGLAAQLHREGEPLGPPLRALSRWSDVFPFVIREEDGAQPRLDHPTPAERAHQAYTVRRDGTDGARLRDPQGGHHGLRLGGPPVELPGGLWLALRDENRSRPEGSEPPRPAPPPGGHPPTSYREQRGDPLL